MKKLPFTGAGVAIVTPFDEKNEINYDEFEKLLNMHIAKKTDAIIVCGTTGEPSTMPADEHLSAVSFAVNKVNHKIPVIAGCGSNDTSHAVMMSKRAERFGADALLSVTPYYNKANKSGLCEHFKTIANSVNLPIILYNVPSRTAVNIPIDTLKKLSEIENIVAIKEASGDIGYVSQIANSVPELYIYSGNDDMTLPILALGGVGVISVAANILPEEMHNICEFFKQGDIIRARKLQFEILDVINKLFIEVNPIPVKSAMRYLGYNVGKVRLPLGEMDENNYKKLIEAIDKLNIKKVSE